MLANKILENQDFLTTEQETKLQSYLSDEKLSTYFADILNIYNNSISREFDDITIRYRGYHWRGFASYEANVFKFKTHVVNDERLLFYGDELQNVFAFFVGNHHKGHTLENCLNQLKIDLPISNWIKQVYAWTEELVYYYDVFHYVEDNLGLRELFYENDDDYYSRDNGLVEDIAVLIVNFVLDNELITDLEKVKNNIQTLTLEYGFS